MDLSSFSLPALSVNLVMVFTLLAVVIYALALGHNKLKFFAISVFVGIVLATTFADGLNGLLAQFNLDKVSLQTLKLILFGLPIVVLEIGRRDHSRKSSGNLLMSMILSVLTAALIIGSVLSLLDEPARQAITDQSFFALEVYQFRSLWLILVPLGVIGENFVKGRS